MGRDIFWVFWVLYCRIEVIVRCGRYFLLYRKVKMVVIVFEVGGCLERSCRRLAKGKIFLCWSRFRSNRMVRK